MSESGSLTLDPVAGRRTYACYATSSPDENDQTHQGSRTFRQKDLEGAHRDRNAGKTTLARGPDDRDDGPESHLQRPRRTERAYPEPWGKLDDRKVPSRGFGTVAFVRAFGDDLAGTEDEVTSISYNGSGSLLAAGDRAGRIFFYKLKAGAGAASSSDRYPDPEMDGSDDDSDPVASPESRIRRVQAAGQRQQSFWFEFQAHARRLDVLRNTFNDEAVTHLHWLDRYCCRSSAQRAFLLSAGSRTGAHLWRVTSDGADGSNPRAVRRRSFDTDTNLPLRSVSLCSDGQTFLTSDAENLLLWNLEVGDEAFSVRPAGSAALSCAAFHPALCSVLACGLQSGAVEVHDIRHRALLGQPTVVLGSRIGRAGRLSTAERGVGVEAQVSDVAFVPRHARGELTVASRDYFGVKLWDVRAPRVPVAAVPVQPFLRSHSAELRLNKCAEDSFRLALSPDQSAVLTGSYDGQFVIGSTAEEFEPVRLQAGGTPPPQMTAAAAAEGTPRTTVPVPRRCPGVVLEHLQNVDPMELDLARKSLNVAWNPAGGSLCVGTKNRVYFFSYSCT